MPDRHRLFENDKLHCIVTPGVEWVSVALDTHVAPICRPQVQGPTRFPEKVIAFEQPARPHAPESRLRAPYARTNRRPFSLAALNPDSQHHAKNNESDNHKGAQHPMLKFAMHSWPHTTHSSGYAFSAYPSAEGRLARNPLASSHTPSLKARRKGDERTGRNPDWA